LVKFWRARDLEVRFGVMVRVLTHLLLADDDMA